MELLGAFSLTLVRILCPNFSKSSTKCWVSSQVPPPPTIPRLMHLLRKEMEHTISDQNSREYLEDMRGKLEFLRSIASLQQDRAHEKNKRLYDRNRRPGEFEVGER